MIEVVSVANTGKLDGGTGRLVWPPSPPRVHMLSSSLSAVVVGEEFGDQCGLLPGRMRPRRRRRRWWLERNLVFSAASSSGACALVVVVVGGGGWREIGRSLWRPPPWAHAPLSSSSSLLAVVAEELPVDHKFYV